LPDEYNPAESDADAPVSGRADALRGIELGNIDARARNQYDIPAEVRGALVVGVVPDSSAAEAGINEGSVIVEVNRQPVRNAEDARAAARSARGGRLLLRLWTSEGGVGTTRYLVLEAARK
jgi:serine protease Do